MATRRQSGRNQNKRQISPVSEVSLVPEPTLDHSNKSRRKIITLVRPEITPKEQPAPQRNLTAVPAINQRTPNSTDIKDSRQEQLIEPQPKVLSQNVTKDVPTVKLSPSPVVDHYNQDFCNFCGLQNEDTLLCCEGCHLAFHFCCACPPLDPESEESFYCQSCSKVGHSKSYKGKFSQILDAIGKMEAKAFRLPVEIGQFFEGVTTDLSGDYNDDQQPVYKAKYSRNTVGITDPQSPALYDEQGRILKCHRCSQTARVNPVIICDYCQLSWHLDCLDHPMTSPPKPNVKWMCPAHADHIIVGRRSRKLSKYAYQVVLADNDLRNDGRVEIQLESEDSFPFDNLRVLKTVQEGTILNNFREKVERRPVTYDEMRIWLEGLGQLATDIASFLHPQVAVTQPSEHFADTDAADLLMDIALGKVVPEAVSSSQDPEYMQFLAWKKLMSISK